MSPRKKPSTLYDLCVQKSIYLLNYACKVIEKMCPESQYASYDREAFEIQSYLTSTLPFRVFDVLCSERTSLQVRKSYRGDPRIQLMVFTHPNMTTFRKCDFDNCIPMEFWVKMFSSFQHLTVLDLKFVCCDEILEVVSLNCTLLEEINIVSRVDIYKSLFNASVLVRNVSDQGLSCVEKLQRLKILTMDPPRNGANKVGRCVSQAGIVKLVSRLPLIEDLHIDTCDVGATITGADKDIGPLSLRTINCHFASGASIKKLLTICPYLNELSITHLSEHNKDAIMNEIADNKCTLNRLELSFFTFTEAVQNLLKVKGQYLTNFSLWEIDYSLTFDSFLCIGNNCPNITSLCLITQSPHLSVPRNYKQNNNIFKKLQNLTIGNAGFDIEDVFCFFLESTAAQLEKIVLKYQYRISIDMTLTKLLEKNRLRTVKNLWFDCTLEISLEVVMKMIKMCECLKVLTCDFGIFIPFLQHHILENNLDLKLGIY